MTQMNFDFSTMQGRGDALIEFSKELKKHMTPREHFIADFQSIEDSKFNTWAAGKLDPYFVEAHLHNIALRASEETLYQMRDAVFKTWKLLDEHIDESKVRGLD